LIAQAISLTLRSERPLGLGIARQTRFGPVGSAELKLLAHRIDEPIVHCCVLIHSVDRSDQENQFYRLQRRQIDRRERLGLT